MKKLSSHYSLIHNCTKPNTITTNQPPLGHSQPTANEAAATFTSSSSSSSLNSPSVVALSTVATPTNNSNIITSQGSNNDNSPTVIDKSILVNDPLHFYHQFKRMNAKQSSETSPTSLASSAASQQASILKKEDHQATPSTDSFRNIVSVVTTSTSNIRSSHNNNTTTPPMSSGNSSSVSTTNVQMPTASTRSSNSSSHHQTVNNSKQQNGEVNISNGKKSNSPTELAAANSTDSVKQITSNTVLPRLPRIRIPNSSNTPTSSGGSNNNTPTNLMTPSSLSNSSSSSSNLMMMQDADISPNSCHLLPRDAPDNPSYINRRIFVGGLKETTSEQELIDFFSRSPNNYGPITHCVIMKKWDGRSRGFGFVTFSDESIAKKVLSDHKEHPFMIGNHRIDCQVAQSQGCKIDTIDIPTHVPAMPSRMVDEERLYTNINVNMHNSDIQSDMIYGASSTDLSRSSSSASSNNSPTMKKDTISSFDKKRRIFVGGLQPQVTKQAVHDYFSKHGTIEDLQLILNRRTPFAFITYTHEDSASKVLDDFHSGVLCKEFAAHDVRRAMPKGSFSFTKQREREMDMSRRPPHRSMPPTEPSARQAPIPNSQPIVPSSNGSRKSGHTPPSYRYTPYEKQGSSRRGMQPYYDHSPTNGPMPPNGFFDVPSSHISMYPTGHPLHHHHQPHIDERYMQPIPGQPLPSTSSFYPPPIPPYYDQPYMMMHHHHHQGMLNGRDQYMPREAGAYRHSDNISNSSGEMDDIRR